jgi:2-polyprenyl-6-methoxyphenol hydroxylase-like FAD-dependent oxidoreductase
MSADSPDVLIAGAGIGGLAAAVALRQAGATVAVVERAGRLTALGAGLSLWPNAVAALRALRTGDAIQGEQIPRGAAGLWRWDGTPLATDDPAEIERRYGAPLVLVHRAELHAALLGALDAGTVQLGDAVAGLTQDARGVRVHLDSGRTADAGLLVAADGLESTVRARVFGDEPPRYSGLVAYRSVVEHPAPERAGEFWGPGGVFGVVPLSGGRVYWYATQHQADPGAARRPEEERRVLLGAFGAWAAPIPALLEHTPADAVLRHPLFDRPPGGRWTSGRVALLGDAAHPMLPFLGQGAGQAIEDAAALGAAVEQAGPVPAALTAYEQVRRRRAEMLVKRSRAAGRVAHLPPGWPSALRDAALRVVPPGLRRRQLDAVVGFHA